MKHILGLDLGTTSIGWAFVNEAEDSKEQSSIIKTGVRVIPLSTDEQNDFKKGNSITINADRTSKRGARRNLQRYKQRRKALLQILKEIKFLDQEKFLSEDGALTHSTYALRAKAPLQKISKEDFAKVLLMINKKRGYKSSRKAINPEEGQLIDGMAVAKELYNNNLTPGQYSYKLLVGGKKQLPEYYRSDLQNEFDTIWKTQKKFYPDLLTEQHKENLKGKNKTQTENYFKKTLGIEKAENKGKNKKLEQYQWRNIGVSEKIEIRELVFALIEINNQINQSSGYLGAISDRSKALFFNNITVGQYQYNFLKENPHGSLKNQVFYRQDYMDEFDAIWKEQSKYYPELTAAVKKSVRDITIFYQRNLKSQKGLISICEFEGKEKNVTVDRVTKKKNIGPRVAPKSSPVFQQAKVLQNINNIRITRKESNEEYTIDEDTKALLFQELNMTEFWSSAQLLKWIFQGSPEKPKDWEVNLKKIEGNRTQASLFKIYRQILAIEGYDNIDFERAEAATILENLQACFQQIGIHKDILTLDMYATGNQFSKQPAYQLWHLLYSYEDDNSSTGIESLKQKLQTNYGFKESHTRLLTSVVFQQDYGNLSVRALRKIYPFLENGNHYDQACKLAGYNHSHSLTTAENENRSLDNTLTLLKKNSLRNPVVEKILNQMINVVNAILAHPQMGRPDEIRVELARELKKTAAQRKEMTSVIAKTTKEHQKYREKIKEEFGLPYVSRKDLIKYKLYLELKSIGFKTLYSGTYIRPEELFTNKFDIEHIIPQSVLFDDSFSNKTLELRDINLEKGNETAFDYCKRKGWQNDFESRIQEIFSKKDIKYGKRKKLLMTKSDIPDDFLNRDLGNSAYIAKKATELLKKISRTVTTTSGTITAKLRSDWELINVLQELAWDKYSALGLTYYQKNKHGKELPRIKDWTKRNDHRHHAMDAITVAFTKPAYIQYLNNMNAKGEKNSVIYGIEQKYTYRNGEGGRKFEKPFENIREESKKHLQSILISHKAKNKVVTLNKNKIKVKGKGNFIHKTELTPRGQLHKETIYGRSGFYEIKEEKVNGKFDEHKIQTITNPDYKEALFNRLLSFDKDPKKAFTGKNSLSKNPVVIKNTNKTIPEVIKTKTLRSQFTIRKNITPDNFKDLKSINKVVDLGIRKILNDRLVEFGGNAKEAFSNLEDYPIWFNKEKGIVIKSAKITGVSNAEPLHYAKDHHGKDIADDQGKPIPVDYVSTGNNHHVAIYHDSKGNLDDEIVTFFEAVERKSQRVPIVNSNSEKGFPLLCTLKQNEVFVFPSKDFDPLQVDLLDPSNNGIISKHLYRVQKFSKVSYGNSSIRDYVFRHHLETELRDNKELKDITWKPIKSLGHLHGIVKVRLNHLGEIVQTGEY
ncbi:type II CRISPR RNA-guided endonuclease Cas9 [Aquimarina sediminis]|uniref:type II CRISPR RNA-guided endonuclease Cas9 n=1 Tax=Aquimarina sediminis TaxID=2070536 RepID=UPI000CA02575|nr:type II CRISPR RNA-guided endonuclease Cas9 [Aquimarina sediminis]